MWNLFLIVVLILVVFVISYKPGSGLLSDWFGIDEGGRRREKQEEKVVEEYEVTSRDMMNAKESEIIFGGQR